MISLQKWNVERQNGRTLSSALAWEDLKKKIQISERKFVCLEKKNKWELIGEEKDEEHTMRNSCLG